MRKYDHPIRIACLGRDGLLVIVRGVTLATLAAGVAVPAWAQFEINRFTFDGGGTTQASGGSYTLGVTIGQPDAGLLTGSSYSLSGGFWGGANPVTGIGDGDVEGEAVPLTSRLHGAAPNPLVHRTVLAFDLAQAGAIRVSLYDASGRLARTLVDEPLSAGRYQRVWDGADDGGRKLAAGIYFVHFDAGTVQARQKIVLLR